MHSGYAATILLLLLFLGWNCVESAKLSDMLDRMRSKLNPGRPTAPPPAPAQIPATTGAVIKSRLGSDVKMTKFDDSGFQGYSGGPVSSGEDLECGFESSFCCWENLDGADQFDWMVGEGTADLEKFRASFGTSARPTQKYLMAVQKTTKKSNQAMFSSCSIACAKSQVHVKFKQWTTPGVRLQVCNKEAFFHTGSDGGPPLLACRDAKKGSGTTTTVTLPAADFVNIVFIASNFTNQYGSVAILDDVNVDYTPCDD